MPNFGPPVEDDSELPRTPPPPRLPLWPKKMQISSEISLRDRFAIEALRVICLASIEGGANAAQVSRQCYLIADAMIKERNKK